VSKLRFQISMSVDGFVAGPGPWGDEPWEGWWGDDPPFRMPVYVLTHHEREPLEKSDTTFYFVIDGPDATHLRYGVRQ